MAKRRLVTIGVPTGNLGALPLKAVARRRSHYHSRVHRNPQLLQNELLNKTCMPALESPARVPSPIDFHI